MTGNSLGYRLVTRSDFDGLACAVLLKTINMVDDIKFVHPKDMQDGKVEITDKDISTNLPYVEGVHLAFDHHHSETIRNKRKPNHIINPRAPSAARVVYDYFGPGRFPDRLKEMMDAVDRADAAQFTEHQVLEPQGWDLLNFIMDARTGLGRFREFKISNYQLMMSLIDACRDNNINEILELDDVKERATLYHNHQHEFKEQLERCGQVHGNVVVLDLRHEETIYAGNRFMIYAIYPDCNVSIHALWGLKKQNTVFAMGKSIFDRSAKVNIGELALAYGGGGHPAAGTCQINNDEADAVLSQLIEKINNAE